MQKVFILDGPDATGKTTLASKLSEIYNIPIYHLTYYNDEKKFQKQFDIANEMLKEWADGKRGGFILDRYIFSEYAYHNVYRPSSRLVANAASLLENIEHMASLRTSRYYFYITA